MMKNLDQKKCRQKKRKDTEGINVVIELQHAQEVIMISSGSPNVNR